MNRKIRSSLLVLVSVLSLAALGRAQTTYEDPQGRFAIDIPPGWQLAPQTDDKVFVFQGEGKSIIIECVPSIGDPAELLKKAVATVRLSGLAKPTLDGDVTEMTVNGLPARWGAYKGLMAGVVLTAFCGGVANGENGLYFLCFVPTTETAAWKGKLEKVFQTIRAPGQTVTGVENVQTAVEAAASTPAVATPWSCDLVSLSLPTGWVEKPKPRGFEKEVRGWFMNDNLPGASLMVICYKGMGMSMPKALEGGIKTMTISIPGLKPVEVQEMEFSNGKAKLVVYQGMAAGGGREVELASVISVIKADKCHATLILTAMASLRFELKTQAIEILKTVK